jgi:hypothetical protein
MLPRRLAAGADLALAPCLAPLTTLIATWHTLSASFVSAEQSRGHHL